MILFEIRIEQTHKFGYINAYYSTRHWIITLYFKDSQSA